MARNNAKTGRLCEGSNTQSKKQQNLQEEPSLQAAIKVWSYPTTRDKPPVSNVKRY